MLITWPLGVILHDTINCYIYIYICDTTIIPKIPVSGMRRNDMAPLGPVDGMLPTDAKKILWLSVWSVGWNLYVAVRRKRTLSAAGWPKHGQGSRGLKVPTASRMFRGIFNSLFGCWVLTTYHETRSYIPFSSLGLLYDSISKQSIGQSTVRDQWSSKVPTASRMFRGRFIFLFGCGVLTLYH